MTDEPGGGASRSTDPAAGTSAATDVSLREHLTSLIVALGDKTEQHFEEIEKGILIAKETADATLLAHNGLLKKMEEQSTAERLARATFEEKFATRQMLNDQIARVEEGRKAEHEATLEKIDTLDEHLTGQIDELKSFRWKVTGALVIASIFLPLITGVVVYILTRTAIPTVPA